MIRKNPMHDTTSPPGQAVSYLDSPNKAQYVRDIVRRIEREERPQEALNTGDAPSVLPSAEKRLEAILGRLQGLYEEMWQEETAKDTHIWTLADIIHTANGDIG